MKKYITAVAAFVLVAAASHAQAVPKKASTENAVVKTSKPIAKKNSATTASVSPSASTPAKKTNTEAATITRKHHKKGKSVKPVSK